MKEKFKVINRELSRIKKELDVRAIIAVGSAKDIILKAQGYSKEKKSEEKEDVIDIADREKDKDINDIDLFIITSEDERKQLRQIKVIEGIEFDLNYFPEQIIKKLLTRKVQFFLEEVSFGRAVHDPEGLGEKYMSLGKQIYESGPPDPGKGNLTYLKFNLQSKLDSIMKLQGGDEGEGIKDEEKELEFFFLSNLWIKNLLVYYFKNKGVWIPRDKRILKILKEQDRLLYDKINNFYVKKEPELLKDIAEYVFYEDGIRLGVEMRFRFKF